MMKKYAYVQGFTLSELLLVVTIIAIMAIIAIFSFQKQTARGYDSKRKADISKFRVLLEDYYNDHECYPTKVQWNAYDCVTHENGEFLKPYLDGKPIPCDPVTNERYLYITLPEDAPVGGPACQGYKLFAALGDTSDPDIVNSGCDPNPILGCGYAPYAFNYGIATGGNIANAEFDFTAPVATVTPINEQGGNWICPPKGNQPAQNCQYYSDECRDLMISRGCATYDTPDKDLCSSLCNPTQRNVCGFLTECY